MGGLVRLFFCKGMWECWVLNNQPSLCADARLRPCLAAACCWRELGWPIVCNGHADVKLSNLSMHTLVP